MASTRRASFMSFFISPSITAIEAGSCETEQNFSTLSGAPLRIAKTFGLPYWPWIVSIHLFSELKGISKSLLFSGFCFSCFAPSGPPCTSLEARRMATSVGEPVHMSSPVAVSFFSSAPLFRMPHTEMASHESAQLLGNNAVPFSRTTTCMPSFEIMVGDLHTTRSCTVISPLVSVPVLSEQKTDTQPSVSTASILRTRTWRFTISEDANMSEIVTVGSRPSGTWEKRAQAVYWIMSARAAFCTILTQRLTKPTMTAMNAMKCTKCSI
mmetsp:Transcript_111160/g.278318  ORF Transcript_111160/g.278318 Transcript_111160/m.278318 type:complete len:268 (+) Transcript_111160:1540-2343(+)